MTVCRPITIMVLCLLVFGKRSKRKRKLNITITNHSPDRINMAETPLRRDRFFLCLKAAIAMTTPTNARTTPTPNSTHVAIRKLTENKHKVGLKPYITLPNTFVIKYTSSQLQFDHEPV